MDLQMERKDQMCDSFSRLRKWQPLESHKCNICWQRNREENNKEWMFGWFQELRESCEQGTIQNSDQVQLAGSSLDDKVQKIRDKLANLQMRMPAWTMLEQIAKEAQRLATLFSRQILSEAREEREGRLTAQVHRRIDELQEQIHALQNSSGILEERDVDEMALLVTARRKALLRSELTYFVQEHVKEMLHRLYRQLDDVNRELEREPDRHRIKTQFCQLYRMDDDVKRHFLVGPVGERPLHVCSLMAAKYHTAFDFEGQGNYVSEGILNGMKEWLKEPQNWNEVYVPYGKDYCAVIGNNFERHEPVKLDNQLFPHFAVLRAWYEHRLKRNSSEERIATLGLYEGETLLYPRIACGDDAMVRWLLDEEQRRNNEPQRKLEQNDNQQCMQSEKEPKWLTDMYAYGLFFQPMHGNWLTSPETYVGWATYRYQRVRDSNKQASSGKSYFGLSVLAFAASQGRVKIFQMLFRNVEQRLRQTAQILAPPLKQRDKGPLNIMKALTHPSIMTNDEITKSVWAEETSSPSSCEDLVRKAILNCKDEFGNTLLHLAAWNDQQEMYTWLVDLGADQRAENKDGLTAFTLTARFGIWSMFTHIWDTHLTDTVWMFGNLVAKVVDYSQFDVKAVGVFDRINDIDDCILVLVDLLQSDTQRLRDGLERIGVSTGSKRNLELEKEAVMNKNLRELYKRQLIFKLQEVFDPSQKRFNRSVFPQPGPESHRQLTSGIMLITLFRPEGWHKHTKTLVEEVVLHKWARGYFLVHLGSSVLPYIVQVAIFGAMWAHRELQILQHDFWWSDSPVKAVIQNPSAESACGWASIRDTTSGRLQAVMIVYGVPALLRLAWVQRRLRPSDLDQNEDMIISLDEIINFLYLNLESLLEIIIAGLFIAIGVGRIAAGDHCDMIYLKLEKNCTAIAALVLFWNMFVLFKPYKGIGLLVLSMYHFLAKEVFSFLLMYSMFFTAFLIALQTLHNANHFFLNWMQHTDTIVPQVDTCEKTFFEIFIFRSEYFESQVMAAQNWTFLNNNNIPGTPDMLLPTQTALNGCQQTYRTIYDTAFSLLEISMGDGLADGLLQTRNYPYQCAGFSPDSLIGYILIFWVFLTNILILNMLIAMMTYMFRDQIKSIDSVWLLDVSYRIIRYEQNFPEIASRFQLPEHKRSVWTWEYWKYFLFDMALVFYCLPEIHMWGLSRAFVLQGVKLKNMLQNYEGMTNKKYWEKCLDNIKGELLPMVEAASKPLQATNSAPRPPLHRLSSVRAPHQVVATGSFLIGLPQWHRRSSFDAGQEQATSQPDSKSKVQLLITMIFYLGKLKESYRQSTKSNKAVRLEHKPVPSKPAGY